MSRLTVPTVFLLAASLAGVLSAVPAQEDRTLEIRGSYDSMSPAQRALIDDWFQRFSRVSGREVDVETAWRNVPLSVRSTYDAVTNALQNNELTDEDGASLGTALDLIERLDWVSGRVRGAGGDRQLRNNEKLKQEEQDKKKR